MELFAARGFSAVTIAEVAAAAGVSVQTVYNHFASKEELFFSGRTPWVDGPAEAVRSREAHVPPLTALRRYLVELVRAEVMSAATEDERRRVATRLSSPALCSYERELFHEAVDRLSGALVEAESSAASCRSSVVTFTAGMTASVWLAAVRTLLLERCRPTLAVDDAAADAAVELTEQILDRLQECTTATSHACGATTSQSSYPADFARSMRRAG